MATVEDVWFGSWIVESGLGMRIGSLCCQMFISIVNMSRATLSTISLQLPLSTDYNSRVNTAIQMVNILFSYYILFIYLINSHSDPQFLVSEEDIEEVEGEGGPPVATGLPPSSSTTRHLASQAKDIIFVERRG